MNSATAGTDPGDCALASKPDMSVPSRLRSYPLRSQFRRIPIVWTIVVMLFTSLLSPIISPVISSALHTIQCRSVGCKFKPTAQQEEAAERLAGVLRQGGTLISGLVHTTVFNADNNWVGTLENGIRLLGNLSGSIRESHLSPDMRNPLYLSSISAHSNLTSVSMHLAVLKHCCSSTLIASIIEVPSLVARITLLSDLLLQAHETCGDAQHAFESFYNELTHVRLMLKDWHEYDHSKFINKLRCLFWPVCDHVKADLASLNDGAPLVGTIKEELSIAINRVHEFASFAEYVKSGLGDYHTGPEFNVVLQLIEFDKLVEALTILKLTIEGSMKTGV